MSNKVFVELTKKAVSDFVVAYASNKELFWDEETRSLRHPGEFGAYRERTTKDLLRLFLPARLGIGSGFIITPTGEISTQCDIIIYDKDNVYLIENTQEQRFFPVESVVAVGEVKSDIKSMTDLNAHLVKLAQIKMLRETLVNPLTVDKSVMRVYNPIKRPLDQMFTFILCNKFNFTFNLDAIKYPEDIAQRHKHNAVLSVQDGLILYESNKSKLAIAFPGSGDGNFNGMFIPNTPNSLGIGNHFEHFIGALNSIKYIPSLDVDPILYFTNQQVNVQVTKRVTRYLTGE